MSDLLTETLENINDQLNIDKLRNNYFVVDYDAIFKSPSFGELQNQKEFLLQTSYTIDMEPRYEQRPEYVSFDEYGTVILAPIIMFINDVFTRSEFLMETIKVPALEELSKMFSESNELFNEYFYLHSRELIAKRK